MIKIGDIRAKHTGDLVCVEGIIILKSSIGPKEVSSSFECPSCGTVISVLQIEKKFREPTRCSCGRRAGFKQIRSEHIDEQRIILEEPLDLLERDVQNINVILQGSLTSPDSEKFKSIGDTVKVTGIVENEDKFTKNGKSTQKHNISMQ